MLVTIKWLMEKYNRSYGGVKLILDKAEILPEKKDGKSNLYNFAAIKNLFSVKDETVNPGEVTVAELIKKYDVGRNLILGCFKTRKVKPVRKRCGYKGAFLYNESEVIPILNDFTNKTYDAVYSDRPDLIYVKELISIFKLSKSQYYNFLSFNKDLERVKIRGYISEFIEREKAMERASRYKKRLIEQEKALKNKDLITRVEIQELYGFSRQRIEQIFSENPFLKHELCFFESGGGCKPAYFYNKKTILKWFSENFYPAIRKLTENMTTIKDLSDLLEMPKEKIATVLRKNNIKAIGRVYLTNAHVFDLKECIKLFDK